MSEFKYRQVIDTLFNLGFPRPKEDQCETCGAFRYTTATLKKTRICILSIKTISKKQKISKIGQYLNKPVALLICSKFCCLYGQSSSFYNKRRLGVFNFTIFGFKAFFREAHKFKKSKMANTSVNCDIFGNN